MKATSRKFGASIPVFFCLVVGAACLRPGDRLPEPEQGEPDPDPDCGNTGEFCYGDDAPCCAGLFCDLDPNSYGQGHCSLPRPDGEVCFSPDECASGQCIDGVCGQETCAGVDAFCYPPEVVCCEGLVCSLDSSAYGEGACIPALEAPEY